MPRRKRKRADLTTSVRSAVKHEMLQDDSDFGDWVSDEDFKPDLSDPIGEAIRKGVYGPSNGVHGPSNGVYGPSNGVYGPSNGVYGRESPADYRRRIGIWKAVFKLWKSRERSVLVPLLILEYAADDDVGGRKNCLIEVGRCIVCVTNWESAARLCNECGANDIWKQRQNLWSDYLRQVPVKQCRWPNLKQISDLDVRCGAMRAFLIKQNRFLNAEWCEEVYRQLTRDLPNLVSQITNKDTGANITRTLLCCFHPEVTHLTVSISAIMIQDLRKCGYVFSNCCEDPATQLYKQVEADSRTVSRRSHLDPCAFSQFLIQGPKKLF